MDTFQSFSCGCGSVCVLHSMQNIEKHCKNQYIKISIIWREDTYLHEFCFKAQFSKRWILIRQSLSICIYTILIFLNLYFFEDFSTLCVMPKLLCMRMRLWPQRKFGWKGQKVFFTPWTKNRQGHKLTIYSSIIKLAMSYWFASEAKIKGF